MSGAERPVPATCTRWAAIGAAIAVTLGAGGFGITHATTDSGAMPIFRPLDAPCRLADTRPAPDTVGSRTAGLGAGEAIDLDGWGATGDCMLPTDTAALQLNVTAVGATQQTNLRFFPAGAPRPTTANLNPSPGAPPTPNAVTVGLNASDGRFSVFNAFGTVAVVVDVIGVYDDHVHTGDDIVDDSLSSTDMRDEPGVAFIEEHLWTTVGAVEQIVDGVRIRPPRSGYVTVDVSANWSSTVELRVITCQITDGTDTIDWEEVILSDTDYSTAPFANQISLSRTFPVETRTAQDQLGRTFNLVCRTNVGSATIRNIHMAATFFPTSYAQTIVGTPLDDET